MSNEATSTQDSSDEVNVQRATVVMEVANLHLTRFNKSRDIEWRVNISFWTAIIVVGGFILDKYNIASHLPAIYPCLKMLAGAFPAFIVAAGHWFWLAKVQGSEEFDKASYYKCRDESLRLVGSLEAIGQIENHQFRPNKSWNFVAAGVTFVFFLIFWILMWFKSA